MLIKMKKVRVKKLKLSELDSSLEQLKELL